MTLPRTSPRPWQILLTWPFLVSLALLLLNDFWFKQAFPGWWTGKLSDVAGIAVVTLPLMAIWPGHRWRVMLAVAVAFAAWKSPLSQPLIDFANVHLLAPFSARIGRVVDYGDLLALLVMPPCALVAREASRFSPGGAASSRILRIPVLLATVLGITATSMMPVAQEFQIRKMDAAAELNRPGVALVLADVAREFGLECLDCESPRPDRQYRGSKIGLRYEYPDLRSVRITVYATRESFFFGGGDWDDLRLITRSIKQRLPRVDADIEYVEQLPPVH
jgi:hypothetical protein